MTKAQANAIRHRKNQDLEAFAAKLLSKHPAKLAKFQKAMKKKASDASIVSRWRKAGIKQASMPNYERMFADQEGRCAICDMPEPTGRRLALDHDHVTGEIRELLCTSCNFRVGAIESGYREDPEVLMNLVGYLNKYSRGRFFFQLTQVNKDPDLDD
jgi:hypothetical protein